MSRKKGYKSRLPTVLPVPAPRTAMDQESLAPVASAPATTEPELGRAPGPPPPEDQTKGLQEPRSRTLLGLVMGGPLAVGAVGLLLALLPGQWWGGPGDDASPPEPAGGPGGAILTDSLVEAQVRPDGDIQVRQWITAEEPLDGIDLALPDPAEGIDVSATGVRVTADGAPVAGATSITDEPARYEFAATGVQVSYRLSGAVERSGSVPGRALAHFTALDVRYSPRAERETRIIRAPKVLALACGRSPDVPPVPCGSDIGPSQWRVELVGAGAEERVSAQVTLTTTGAE